jgi:hypothetical protein
MAQPILADIADALVATLNGGTFETSFESARSYGAWDERLASFDKLQVDVVPVTVPVQEDQGLATRDSVKFDYSFDVIVRKRFGANDQGVTGSIPNSKIDPLVRLTEQIVTFVPMQFLDGYDEAIWQSTKLRFVAYRKHLREWHQYTGLVRVAYAVMRDVGT